MTEDKNIKTPDERIDKLEKKVQELSERGGGMLSSSDFRKRVIFRRNDDDESYAKIEAWFRKRDWDNAEDKKEIRKYKGVADLDPRKCFIVEPYDELNLTPFSYDLSIGNEIFSVRKKDPIRKRLPYEVMPGETVIVLTREFIALPPCYSATVWPRFKLVRGGVFQSMVKIDPTWYGKLGVAMTNLSPRTIPLTEGMAFGTLVMYELSSNTDIDLWQPEKLKDIRVEIPNIPIRKTLQETLVERDLTSICWVEDNSLVVRGLKKSSYDELRKIDGSKPWLDTVEKAKSEWLKLEHEETKRKSIGMEALGMDDLEKLTSGKPMGKWLDKDIIESQGVTDKELYDTAVEYGRPFDLFANIPNLVMDTIEKEVIPRIRAEVEANIFPKIITLTLTVLGFLSLIIAVAAFLMDKYRPKSPSFMQTDWSTTVSIGLFLLGAILLVAFCILIFRKSPYSRAIRRLERKIQKLEKGLKNKNSERK